MIETLCYIVLVACGVGIFWALYLMYLDWIWGWQDHKIHSKPIYRPAWTVEDQSGTEIARFD